MNDACTDLKEAHSTNEIETPEELRPVLAQINHLNSLGKSSWYEVVYFDTDRGLWCCYAGSDTFKDGHQVIKWKYVDSCFSLDLTE